MEHGKICNHFETEQWSISFTLLKPSTWKREEVEPP